MGVSQLEVLVVDDGASRLAVQAILHDLDVAEVTVVTDAHAALAELRSCRPADVVVCNLALEAMDGVELLRAIAGRRIDTSVVIVGNADPSVLLSAVAMARAYGLRVLAGLPLPLSRDRLRRALEKHGSERRGVRPEACSIVLTPQQIGRAMADGAIVPYFQPILEVSSGRPVAVEALVRWVEDGVPVVAADVLVDAMERLGMIASFTDWMFERAAEWQLEHGNRFGLGVAVNASLAGLSDVAFPDRCAAAVRDAGCDPERFTLEITESSVMRDVGTALDILTRLRLKGLRLALDDFGTGYASLHQLTTIPCTELKIDKEFVTGVTFDDRRRSVLASAIELAHVNGLVTVAEGCETGADLAQLDALGCDRVQGYLFSRPLPAPDLARWLASQVALVG